MQNLLYSPNQPTAPNHLEQAQSKGFSNVYFEEARISVCIVCRNEADKLELCLRSVLWADEIIVMDLSSTDSSGDIASAHGARVIVRDPHPIVEPLRNELAAAANGTWILALDPDERITPGLARELRQLTRRADLDAIFIPRMNFDLGYPPSNPLHRYEPQLRMYRRDAVEWPPTPNALPRVPDHRLYHVPQCDDLVIIHDRSRNIPEVLDRFVRYAPAEAQSMVDRGMSFTAYGMFAALITEIDKEFFRGQAWRDGVPGILRAFILVTFRFFVWAGFWQLSGGKRTATDDRLLRRFGTTVGAIRQLFGICGASYRFARRILRR